ncbi:hypothetical protein P43SY_003280 [Pythium insidiosum]|uniref:Retrotransposon gag domain-containing protein n=1 Tax=Pythium insidiosum TaxID=114742 RepID=A0AAD5LWQ8_PYTIN|nr:hypothetical protein P43SY_003280 [Pythium insidiosum]
MQEGRATPTRATEPAHFDLRVDLRLPVYSGGINESYELYYAGCVQFFQAKGYPWQDHALRERTLAILANTLRGAAAQWFLAYRELIASPDDFFARLAAEFVPADLQHRLRDQLFGLHQRHCRDLVEYVGKFRDLMMRIQDMSEIDRIQSFTRGLMTETKKEVEYKRYELQDLRQLELHALLIGVGYPYAASALRDLGFLPFIATLSFFLRLLGRTLPETLDKTSAEIQRCFAA